MFYVNKPVVVGNCPYKRPTEDVNIHMSYVITLFGI